MNWIKSEPAVFFGLIQAALGAILNAVLVFGVEVTAEQIAAINTVVLALTAIILSVWTRSRVTPTSSV